MDALRLRLASALEWAVAAAFLAATLGVASLILRDMNMPAMRTVAAAQPVTPVTPIPSAVPAGAVSVPVLPFADGKEIKVGDSARAVSERLGRAAETGREDVDRGRLGARLTRFYEYAGFRFIVVYEPFERNGEPRATAIYLP
jgi:hypothetical protein